jgi:hypothetical protein
VGLSHAYKKLGKVIQATGDFHAAQGTAEATTLGDPLQYHSSDAFIAKETLTNRHILLRELLQAQAQTKSKLSAADRLKASSSVKRDKVDEAIAALDEARSHEQYLTTKAQRVTANLLQEQRRWFGRTAHDMNPRICTARYPSHRQHWRAFSTWTGSAPCTATRQPRKFTGAKGRCVVGRSAPARRRAQPQSKRQHRGSSTRRGRG